MENMIAPRKDVDLLTFLELRQAHRAVEAAQVRNAYFFAFRARLDAARIVYKERDGSAELIIIIIIIIIGVCLGVFVLVVMVMVMVMAIRRRRKWIHHVGVGFYSI